MSAKGFRLRVFTQAASPVVDHEFYVGVSVEASSIAAIPDIPSPVPDPYTGAMRSQNVQFQVASEAITADIGASDRLDWTGRLVDWSETTDDGGSYTVLWTGRVASGPGELAGPGLYTLVCQDENWLTRKQKLFSTAGGTTMLYPWGLTADWGPFKANDDPVWLVTDVDGADRLQLQLKNPPDRNIIPKELSRFFLADMVNGPIGRRSDGDGNFEHTRFRDISGAADREIVSLSGNQDSPSPFTYNPERERPTITFIWVYWPSHGKVEGQEVTGYLYAPTAPPSDVNPRHLGGASGADFGEFLVSCFDGTYNETPVRLDTTAAFATWDASTNPRGLKSNPVLPRVLARITEPKDDDWLREYLLAPVQLVPFTDVDGRLSPTLWRIPQDVAPASLTTLTASNGAIPTFDPRGNEAVTVLRFGARTVTTTNPDGGERWSPDGLFVEESTPDLLTKTHDNVASLGRREKTLNLTALRPSGELLYAFEYERLAREIGREVFERVGDGPVWYTLETHQSDVMPGDYCILDADTLKFPNPATNARSGDRIVQVAVRTIQQGGASYRLECQDIGPSAAVLSAPTVAASATGEHTVDVTISGLSAGQGYRLFVDRGAGFEPEGTGDDNETVTVRECPSGTLISAKAVATSRGRIRSAFSTTASDTTTAITAPSGLSTSVSETEAVVTWANGDADYPVEVLLDGVRVALLEPGTTRYTLRGLAASTTYNSPGVGVRHVDEFGGASSTTSASFTTAATVTTAPDTNGIAASAVLKRNLHNGKSLSYARVYLYPGNPAFGWEIQRAPDSGGSPGTYATVERASGSARSILDPRSADGATYWYRGRHVRDGYTEGAWSTAVSVTMEDVDEEEEHQIGDLLPTRPGMPFGAPKRDYLDDDNRPVLIHRQAGGVDVDADDLFDRTREDLDDVSDGATYGKADRTYLNAGAPYKLYRQVGAVDVDADNLFDTTREDLDNVSDGASFARVQSGDLASGRVKKLPPTVDAEGDVYIVDTAAPKVGTSASPSTVTKTLRIPAAELIPSTDTRTWTFPGDGVICPRSTGSTEIFLGSVVMPPGVTATTVYMNGSRASVSDDVEVKFLKTTGVGVTASTIATLTHSTTGAQTVSSSISEAISASNMYWIQVSVQSAAVITDAKFAYFEIEYTMPSYDKGI